jgi:hypothetical protein
LGQKPSTARRGERGSPTALTVATAADSADAPTMAALPDSAAALTMAALPDSVATLAMPPCLTASPRRPRRPRQRAPGWAHSPTRAKLGAPATRAGYAPRARRPRPSPTGDDSPIMPPLAREPHCSSRNLKI